MSCSLDRGAHAVPGSASLSTPALAVRWGLSQGLLRQAVAALAWAGNEDAAFLRDPARQVEPSAHYRRLRSGRPFFRGPLGRATAHHDVVAAVLGSNDFGVAGRREAWPLPLRLAMQVLGPRPYAAVNDAPSLLALDPPDHARFRRLVTRAFTVRRVAALRVRTEQLVEHLLDELAVAARTGPVDLVESYAALVPVTVIAEMLGVPPEAHHELLGWGDAAASSLDLGQSWSDYARSERSLAAFDAWLRDHLRTVRANPGDHLLGSLVRVTDDDGSGLTEHELVAIAMLLLAAGFETTANLIANGAARLFEHPDQRAALADDPSLWPNAVDEVLRHDTPVARTVRYARRETEIAGVPFAPGELAVTVLSAANRDPSVFADPDRFDVARPNAREHVAFSRGVHYCLGASLARMEGEVALRALFTRFPGLAAAGPPVRRPTLILRGYSELPVTV